MNINDLERNEEKEWLGKVLLEAQKQLNENANFKERFVKDAVQTQKELWQEVGVVSASNGLEQIVEFMSFINTMKRQKRGHELARKLKEKYERMISSPYFGRIDFLEEDETKPEKYYIGVSNLINDDYDFFIYDWRAPVCSMFYDYEIGKASYACPQGTVSGEMILKRQYKIFNGKIEYMFDSNLKIDDEMLQEILSKSTDSKMKTIVTTIQREQNKIIRNEEYKNLIVQGPAGSGKTSIALHRIAYLLYKHRDKITPKNIVIFSPNQIFNDYISNVLPQLGEDNMYQTTFKEYMHKALNLELVKEDFCDVMEYILSCRKETGYQRRINSIKYKASPEFVHVLKEYANYVEKKDRNFKDITFRDKLIISANDISDLFYKDYVQFPLKRRLKKIRERIVYLFEPYEKERMREVDKELVDAGFYIDKVERIEKSITLVREETKDIYDEIHRITDFDLLNIYRGLFDKLEHFVQSSNTEEDETIMDEIKRYTLESLKGSKLNYEDQPPLLYLMGLFGDVPRTSEIKYVIIDEAQDYTPMQFEIFYQLFHHASITMLGDLNQSINPFMNVGNYTNIAGIFPGSNTQMINLNKSYRSTMEITDFTRSLLNKVNTDECVGRRGEKPLILGFENEDSIKGRILSDIGRFREQGYKSIGILARTLKEANDVYGYLKDKAQVKLVAREDDEYQNDTIIMPAYLAKGLEFDVVLIYNAGNENYNCEEERMLFYTACTRALHVLHIYYSGRISSLLA